MPGKIGGAPGPPGNGGMGIPRPPGGGIMPCGRPPGGIPGIPGRPGMPNGGGGTPEVEVLVIGLRGGEGMEDIPPGKANGGG